MSGTLCAGKAPVYYFQEVWTDQKLITKQEHLPLHLYYPCHLYQQMNIFYRKGKFCSKLTPYFTSNNRYLKRQYFFKISNPSLLWLTFYNLFITAFSNGYIFHPPTKSLRSLHLRHKLTNPNLAITEAYKYI